jgi:hypothetical protein
MRACTSRAAANGLGAIADEQTAGRETRERAAEMPATDCVEGDINAVSLSNLQ